MPRTRMLWLSGVKANGRISAGMKQSALTAVLTGSVGGTESTVGEIVANPGSGVTMSGGMGVPVSVVAGMPVITPLAGDCEAQADNADKKGIMKRERI